jgi:hypothetical protein
MKAPSRAALHAQLAIARASASARRPAAAWPPGFALARYLILSRQAAAGLAGASWRVEMNVLRPLVLGPVPAPRRTVVRAPRRSA